MSMPPRLGNRLRTGRITGSVTRVKKSASVQTARLRVSSTLNPISNEMTAAMITAQNSRFSPVCSRKKTASRIMWLGIRGWWL